MVENQHWENKAESKERPDDCFHRDVEPQSQGDENEGHRRGSDAVVDVN